MEIDLSHLISETTASIARLLGRNAETSRQAMEAVRRSLDTACRSLEQTGTQDENGEEIQKLIEQLTRAVADHFQSGIEGLQREADIRVKAAIAETRRQRHEVATLSSQLEEARAEIQALRDDREADRGRGQGTAATAEAGQQGAEVAEADELRLELEHERKHSAALVLEVGQYRADSMRLEETRVALQALRDERAGRGYGETPTGDEQLRAEVTELSDRLNEVSTEAGRLRIELETERKQAASMVLEIGQARLAAQRAEKARDEMAAEVAVIHQRLQTAAAARLVTAADVRDPVNRPSAAHAVTVPAPAPAIEPTNDTLEGPPPTGSLRRRLAAMVRG